MLKIEIKPGESIETPGVWRRYEIAKSIRKVRKTPKDLKKGTV